MSKTTAGIMRINQELDKISGLDDIVADKIEELEQQVKSMVSDILANHSEVSIFNKAGGIKEVLEDVDKEPLLDEVIDNGNVIVSRAYCDGEIEEFVRYQIIKYEGSLYYIEHTGTECTAFREL